MSVSNSRAGLKTTPESTARTQRRDGQIEDKSQANSRSGYMSCAMPPLAENGLDIKI